MTSRIIYHDFRNPSELSYPTSPVMLTAPILAKGRRFLRAVEAINTAINAACIFLCGACTVVSLLILFMLSLQM